jgi:hypothetical protein
MEEGDTSRGAAIIRAHDASRGQFEDTSKRSDAGSLQGKGMC